MKEVRIKENSWLAKLAARKLKSKRIAMVIGYTIHLYGTSAKSFVADKRWLQHELVHVEQYEQAGFTSFLLKYIWQSFKYGYHNNKYEHEARNIEKQQKLENKYKITLPET